MVALVMAAEEEAVTVEEVVAMEVEEAVDMAAEIVSEVAVVVAWVPILQILIFPSKSW